MLIRHSLRGDREGGREQVRLAQVSVVLPLVGSPLVLTCFMSASELPFHSAGITETTWWKGSLTLATTDTMQRSQLFTWTGMCDHVGFARFVSF